MRKTRKRELILRSARKVFAEKGYHNATVSDIIETADIARGTFYLYFHNKKDIFEELMKVLFAEILKNIKNLDASYWWKDEKLYDQVEDLAYSLFQTIDENRDLARILLTQPAGLDPELDQQIDRFFDVIATVTQNMVENGIKLKRLRRLNSAVVPYIYIGSVKEILYQWIVKEKFQGNQDEMIREVVTFFLNAILPPEKIRR